MSAEIVVIGSREYGSRGGSRIQIALESMGVEERWGAGVETHFQEIS